MTVCVCFQLKEDMENYVRYKLMGGAILMKPEVVPHIFDCQPDRKRAASSQVRPLAVKRARRDIIEEVLIEESELTPTKSHNNTEFGIAIAECSPSLGEVSTSTAECSQLYFSVEQHCPTTSAVTEEENWPLHKDVAIQVRPHYRSKYVTCRLDNTTKSDTASSPITYSTRDMTTSPIKNVKSAKKQIVMSSSSGDSSSSEGKMGESSTFTATASSTDLETREEIIIAERSDEKERALKIMTLIIERKPKSYLGVPNVWFPHFISLLQSQSLIKKEHILLTLIKIKLNDSFSRLGDQFGMSLSNTSKIFKKSLIVIDGFMKTLIYWPDKKRIKKLLPIPFRVRYNSVQSIIDCFEIQIEKPSDPVKQSLTWSEYKKCNTLKYLISSTPDGFINYVSSGYGGRISDVLLLESCGFLDVIPPGCTVMADRGFKHIDRLLSEKQCKLVKPPSVSSTTTPTRLEVIETKRIASLRIHIERVIRRVREFNYVKPHSVINHNLVGYTDHVVRIVAGLINLQSPIIRQY